MQEAISSHGFPATYGKGSHHLLTHLGGGWPAGVQGAQNCARMTSHPDKYEFKSFGAVNLGVVYSLKLLAAIPVTAPGFDACGKPLNQSNALQIYHFPCPKITAC